jgi:hypothetical protein
MKEIKKSEQASLGLEDYVQGIEENLKHGFHGVITQVTEISSAVYYKDDSGRFEARDGVSVLVKVEEDGTEFTSFFAKPTMKGWGIKSNLYQFKQQYKTVPKVGLKVECVVKEDGFFRIKF